MHDQPNPVTAPGGWWVVSDSWEAVPAPWLPALILDQRPCLDQIPSPGHAWYCLRAEGHQGRHLAPTAAGVVAAWPGAEAPCELDLWVSPVRGAGGDISYRRDRVRGRRSWLDGLIGRVVAGRPQVTTSGATLAPPVEDAVSEVVRLPRRPGPVLGLPLGHPVRRLGDDAPFPRSWWIQGDEDDEPAVWTAEPDGPPGLVARREDVNSPLWGRMAAHLEHRGACGCRYRHGDSEIVRTLVCPLHRARMDGVW